MESEKLFNQLATPAKLVLEDAREDKDPDFFYVPLNENELLQLYTQMKASLLRVAGTDSVYWQEAKQIFETEFCVLGYRAPRIAAICMALAEDIRNGYVETLRELVHADLFADYLEMASHLVEEKYKDAAAVIAGSTLEGHLKQLATKHLVELLNEHGKPKKIDMLNSDLVKANAYNKLDQKQVTAWLGIRNDAAHGNYDEYGFEQVELMIDGIRSFISRTPA